MATYVNDLRLKEIATGDESGTWGTSTNTNLELIAEGFSYATVDPFDTDADKTETMADGATDPIRSLYVKVTSTATLTATRTLTLAPNTVSKVWIIENATTGGQSITISQGSGSTVTIPNGDVKVIYTDGAGATAAVTDAFANLKVTDPAQTNITSVGTLSSLTVSGDLTVDTNTLYVDSTNNRVGIGTTSPAYPLDVQSGGVGTVLRAGTSFVSIDPTGSASAPSLILNGDVNTGFWRPASDTLAISTTGTERVRIDSSGNVGIGETSIGSGTNLQVNGAGLFKGGSANPLDSSGAGLRIGYNTTSGYGFLQSGQTGVAYSDLYIQPNGSNNTILNSSGGNVGIGTTSPTNVKLQVNGSLSGTAGTGHLAFGEASTPLWNWRLDTTTADLILDRSYGGWQSTPVISFDRSSGNVGIGTSSPSNDLQVGDATDATEIINIASTGNGYLTFGDAADNDIGFLQYNHASNFMAFATNTAEAMRIDSSGNVGIGKTPNRSRKLEVAGTMNLDDGSEYEWGDGSISIGGNSSTDVMTFATASAERMRIDSGGHVLVGKTSGTSGNKIETDGRVSAGAGSVGQPTFNCEGDTNTGINLPESDRIQFITGGSERMRIDSSGNVGIGTSSPQKVLDVTDSSSGESIPVVISNKDITAGTGQKVTLGFGLSRNSGSFKPEAGTIEVGREKDWTAADNNIDSYMAFSTYLNNAATEKVRIDSSGNVGIGTSSPASWFTGANNLVIEGSSDSGLTIDSGTTSVGRIHFADGTTGDNRFRGIVAYDHSSDAMYFVSDASERMRIDSSGELMVNTTSNPNTLNSSGQLNMVCSTGDGVNIKHTNNGFNLLNLWQTGTSTFNAIGFYKGNTQTTVGLITCTTSATSYNTSSDYRLKENIQPLANGLERVQQLNPVQFDWKESGETSEGFIAHEVQEIFSDAIVGEKDGEDMQGMDYGRITPLLVKAIQEQQTLIEQLQAEVALLKGE